MIARPAFILFALVAACGPDPLGGGGSRFLPLPATPARAIARSEGAAEGRPSFSWTSTDSGPAPVAGSWPKLIASENKRPGTRAWLLSAPATAHEIEGYASSTSVNLGDTIRFYVSTVDPSFSIEIFRLGWYGGEGARSMGPPVSLPGGLEMMPVPDSTTWFVECQWSPSWELTIPAGDPLAWPSGVYLAKLTAQQGKQSYIPFVVRDDQRPSAILFQSSVSTNQAYNNWGGHSTYSSNSTNHAQAVKVSFNRPYAEGYGAGRFFDFEINMLRFLEREGYDVTYATSIDTHRDPNLLDARLSFLSVGHDEYWSYDQRTQVESARDSGVHLGFFGSNAGYWQVRYEPSPSDGEPNRTLVAYKELAAVQDPYWREIGLHARSTARFRDLGRPEAELIGVMYNGIWPVDADMVIHQSDAWPLAGLKLLPGEHLPGLVGYETDAIGPDSPPGITLIAHSKVTGHDGLQGASDMTAYTHPSGANVFATGSMYFSWGLDDFPGLFGTHHHRSRVNASAQQITRNVLDIFSGAH
jgi:hypothetical protein